MDMLKLCSKCKRDGEETFHGYIGWVDENCYECPICQSKMTDTILTTDEYNFIVNISNDISFLEAMIKLKQDDIIEFQSRMSQFKTQLQQQKSSKQKEISSNTHTPQCPFCKSTNIRKIGSGERAVSIIGLGIFSKKINKSFKCNSCGGTF